ncbi:hypothetical protein RN629_03100 [Sphingomonadaceae bacterium jetA1]|jgi:hypothetical protein|uniref:hypothetical protein n=1 Tax=Facivitalis istanbulensis TaxID=3075838 RepID=UPI00348313BB
MRITPFLPLSLALPLTVLAACAPTAAEQARMAQRSADDQTALARDLRGLVAQKPTQCISQYQTQQMRAYGPTIVYTVSPRLKYVSRTQGGCEGVGEGARNDILVTRTSTGQLCAGDIAQTVDRTSGFFTGSCSFGPFVPYRAGK